MKTNDWIKYKVITPSDAIREFIQSYSINMNTSLQVIVHVINQARNGATQEVRESCLQRARETVDNMKTGLELMRKNILCVNKKKV